MDQTPRAWRGFGELNVKGKIGPCKNLDFLKDKY